MGLRDILVRDYLKALNGYTWQASLVVFQPTARSAFCTLHIIYEFIPAPQKLVRV
jgi:hypothetical protein